MKIGIVGYGIVGSSMERLFRSSSEHTVAVYDRFRAPFDTAAHKAAIDGCDLVFLCVPTPIGVDGLSCDLSAVEDCVRWVQAPMCLRSTIPPGTCDRLSAETGRPLAFSPEYLGESSAHPWPEDGMCGFLIAGGPDSLLDLVVQAYTSVLPAGTRFYRTSAITAEVCKYMENCFLATKVAFVNQFYDIAATFHVDYEELRTLWLADTRIGDSHTRVTEERGFRGRCLPKDLAAMIATMRPLGGAPFLEALRTYNDAVCAAADRRREQSAESHLRS